MENLIQKSAWGEPKHHILTSVSLAQNTQGLMREESMRNLDHLIYTEPIRHPLLQRFTVPPPSPSPNVNVFPPESPRHTEAFKLI